MIWFQLALFAVSFVLTALLAPKPEFENARAQDLDPDNFPKASESDPVPLLLGCAKIKGPNTLYYGDYQAIPIKEKVKTGLFSSTTVIKGHTYYLTLDLGLCLGPAELKTIFIDSEPVDPGTVFSSEEQSVLYENDTIIGTPAPTVSPYVVDLVTDLGLTEEEIDNGSFTVTVRGYFRVRSGSNQGA